jgi:hypothetical protein
VLAHRGETYLLVGRYDEALADFARALEPPGLLHLRRRLCQRGVSSKPGLSNLVQLLQALVENRVGSESRRAVAGRAFPVIKSGRYPPPPSLETFVPMRYPPTSALPAGLATPSPVGAARGGLLR